MEANLKVMSILGHFAILAVKSVGMIKGSIRQLKRLLFKLIFVVVILMLRLMLMVQRRFYIYPV